LLLAEGYQIVARRWKTPLGEIDIVARRRRALACPRPQDTQRDIRFDVVLVTPGRLPKHIANAFDAGR